MAIGDIIFVKSKTFTGRIVALVDGGSLSSFSHCCISLCEDNSHILEAQGFTRSQIRPFNYTDYEIVPLNLTEEQKQLALKVAIELTGIPYDYDECLGILIDRMMGQQIHRLWVSTSEYICSRICVEFNNRLGLANLDNGLTPNELYKALKERT